MTITVKRVKEAYQKTGLKPVDGAWFKYDENLQLIEACPLGVLVVADHGPDVSLNMVDEELEVSGRLGLTMDYVMSFASGYDAPEITGMPVMGAVVAGRRVRRHIPPVKDA